MTDFGTNVPNFDFVERNPLTSEIRDMGLRCECPQGHVLNIKEELAGKVGICPHCKSRFLIQATEQKKQQLQDTAAEASGIVATEPPKLPEADTPPTRESSVESEVAIEWRLASPAGEQYGPTVPTLFAQWISQGRVPPDWLVWRTGWQEWKIASEVETELPAPLPNASIADTPPPISREPSVAVPKSSKPNQSVSVSAKDKYALRKKRNAFRQKIIIGFLGVVATILVVLLILFTGGE